MQLYVNVLQTLLHLSTLGSKTEEHWHHLRITGNINPVFLVEFNQLQQQFIELGFKNVLQLIINDNSCDQDDFDGYNANPTSIRNWEIYLNKQPVVAKPHTDGWHYNFFLTTSTCNKWLSDINPLLKSCPINELNRIRIFVGDLIKEFGGKTVQFLSTNSVTNIVVLDSNYQLPKTEQLEETIHFITSDDILIRPAAWQAILIRNNDLENTFRKKACIVLTSCLVTEYHNTQKVIIDGIRRIVLSVFDGNEILSNEFYIELQGIVSWIFEDRATIRKKLFNERLSLDLDINDSLLTSLAKTRHAALDQAKERYNFIIIDRKDAYVKELKELLKDIRTQSELYSSKIRSLLSNFLRDLLAALVLIGFTLFTKFTETDKLAKQNQLKLVFYGLSIYYIISIILQSVIDITDVQVSKKEILYWKNATKELLPEKEFTNHINESLKGRRQSLRVIYPIVAGFYIAIAFVCFRFPLYYSHFITQPEKSMKHQPVPSAEKFDSTSKNNQPPPINVPPKKDLHAL